MEINRVINGYRIRSVCAEDKETYLSLRERHLGPDGGYWDMPPYSEEYWRIMLMSDNMIAMLIQTEDGGVLVGSCVFAHIHSDTVELMGDVEPFFCGTDVELEVGMCIAELAREVFPDRRIEIRLPVEATGKQSVVEQCGAVFCSLGDLPVVRYVKLFLEERGDKHDELKSRLTQIAEDGKDRIAIYCL